VIEMIRQYPWLGYGYGAFWAGGWSGESAHVSLWVSRFANDPVVVHAHNGFLDLLLDLGLLGLATFALGFSLATLRAVYWVRATRTAAGLWPLVYLTFILLYNFTESSILQHNNVFWILYVTVSMLTAARFSDSIGMTRWMRPRPGDSRRRQAPAFSEGRDV
jgi:O-antigen ligase